MPFTRKQDSLLTCRDHKFAKTFSNVGNRSCYEKKIGHAPTITTKMERLLHDQIIRICRCLDKGCFSTSSNKCSIQRHFKECYNYSKRAEGVAKNKVFHYCGMHLVKSLIGTVSSEYWSNLGQFPTPSPKTKKIHPKKTYHIFPKISYILRRMLTNHKISYPSLYSGMTSD